MKNIFLYSPRDSEWYREAQRCLRGLPFMIDLIDIPPGAQFSSPIFLKTRTHDLFILLAEEEKDLDVLLTMRNGFSFFDNILIIKEKQLLLKKELFLLYPRYTALFSGKGEDVSLFLNNYFYKKIYSELPSKYHGTDKVTKILSSSPNGYSSTKNQTT